MELTDLTKILQKTEFKVFETAINAGGAVFATNAPRGAILTRKQIDALTEWICDYGAKGLAWTKLNEDGTSSSSYEKYLSQEEAQKIREQTGAKPGDIIFLVANASRGACLVALGALRLELAKRLNLIDKSRPNLLWIYDFPMFEYSEEEKRLVAKHHPFTMPRDEDIPYLENEPQKVLAKAYDLVLNGNEVGGGSIRIHKPELQKKILEILGFSEQRAQESFGFLTDALNYGAPPHGGFAFGLDRLVMLLLDCENIRETIAFPKVSSSAELMSGAPGHSCPEGSRL
jgi:aspartyl-tRNA synthetase